MTTTNGGAAWGAERRDPSVAANEATTLRSFLDYYRDTIRIKTSGLTQAQLAIRLAPAELTLGGMIKHLAFVEVYWLVEVLAGGSVGELWASADWEADEDWDWHSAVDDTPDELCAMFDEAVAESDRLIDEALAREGLETRSVKKSRRQEVPFNLRWILVHLIEEYARHAGHTDLIRESIDGQVGD